MPSPSSISNIVSLTLRTSITKEGQVFKPFRANRKTSDIPSPATNWLMADLDVFIVPMTVALGDPNSGGLYASEAAKGVQHVKKRNYVFFDGHGTAHPTNYHHVY